MTVEDIGKVQTLERTKILLVNKLEKFAPCSDKFELVQSQIEELQTYLERIEDQLSEIMTQYRHVIHPNESDSQATMR